MEEEKKETQACLYCITEFDMPKRKSYHFLRNDGKGCLFCDVIDGWGFVNNVVVRAEYRRQGICGQMLEMVERYFREEKGISSFYLVCKNDWHVTLYEKYGYTVSDDTRDVEEGYVKMGKDYLCGESLITQTKKINGLPYRLITAFLSFNRKYKRKFIAKYIH